jgi:hypothetical protein
MPGYVRRSCQRRKKLTKEKRYMNRQKHNRVIISGGGTGGHIFPAISIANALRKLDPEMQILFVGAEGRMEMEKVPAAGYDIVGLPVAGFNRKLLHKNIPVLFKLVKSLRLASRILKDFRPDVVVGVGGYASGPVLRQAGKMGIPALIQEQNRKGGLLGRKLEAVVVEHPGELVVVVSHADPIKAAIAHYTGVHLDLFQRIMVSPASVTAFAFTAHGVAMLKCNDTGTLDELRPPEPAEEASQDASNEVSKEVSNEASQEASKEASNV